MESEKQLLDWFTPQVYAGPNGVEVAMIMSLEDTKTVIHEHLGKDPKEMNALEWMNDLRNLQKRFKKSNHGQAQIE